MTNKSSTQRSRQWSAAMKVFPNEEVDVPDLSIGEVDGERWIQSIIIPHGGVRKAVVEKHAFVS
jgi:hypothetical protein